MLFAAKKHDAWEKSQSGTRGRMRNAAKSALDEHEAIESALTTRHTAASCSKSSSGGRSCDVNNMGDSKPISEHRQYSQAESKMDLTDAFEAAVPINAEEDRRTKTTMKSSSTPAACSIQTLPPRRLFQLSVDTIRDNKVQLAGKACSQSELPCNAEQTEDRSSGRRNKRCKLSSTACESSAEHGVSRHSTDDEKQFSNDTDNKSLDSVPVDKTGKKDYVKRENTASHRVPESCTVTKDVRFGRVKGKKNEAVCSSSMPEVNKVVQKSSDKHAAIAENWYYLRSTRDDCELYAGSGSAQRSGRKSATKKCQREKKSSVERVASREVDVKLVELDSENKFGDSKSARSPQKSSRHKNGSKTKTKMMEVNDEVMTDSCSRNTNQNASRNLRHSAQDQKLAATREFSGRGRGTAQGRLRSFAGNRNPLPRGKDLSGDCSSFERSTHIPADRQSGTSNLEQHRASELDSSQRTRAAGCWYRGRGSRSVKPSSHFNTQDYCTKTAVSVDQCSVFKNSSETADISEDWEVELFTFSPSEQNATASAESVSDNVGEICCVGDMCCVEETVTTSTYSSADSNGSTTFASDFAEICSMSTAESGAAVSSIALQLTETSMDHSGNQDSSSSGKVNPGLDCESKQMWSELYHYSVTGEKCVNHAEVRQAEEASNTSVSLLHNASAELEIVVPCNDAAVVNCDSPHIDKRKWSFTGDTEQEIAVALPAPAESDNVRSDNAGQYKEHPVYSEIIEPYEIGDDDFFSSPQSQKCSDEIHTGKQHIVVISLCAVVESKYSVFYA